MNIKYKKNKSNKKIELSPYIIKKDNGQIEFISWSKKNHQHFTDIAKAAREEYNKTKASKKALIKLLLSKCNYDPTIKYTRKEKKRFTSYIKKNFFVKHEPAKVLTDKEYKIKFKVERELKNKRREELPYRSPLTVKSKKITNIKQEKPIALVVDMHSKEDPDKTYEFYTTYSTTTSKEDSKNKAIELAKDYKDNSDFAGITIKNMQTNEFIYYTKEALKEAA